jgi:hypothetical protein
MNNRTPWLQPSLGVLIQAIFLAALGIAYVSGDSNALTLMYGAVIANSTTVINFYYGSSKGSQEQRETIAAKLNGGAADQPVAIAISGAEAKP